MWIVNFIRTQLATVQGASIPLPYGGKTRAVSVDLDPNKLQAHNISPHTENPEESKLNRRNWFARIHEGFNHEFLNRFAVRRNDHRALH